MNLFTFPLHKRFKSEGGLKMVSDTEAQVEKENFSLLVRRARQQALLKSILVSVGTSLVFHYLIRSEFFGTGESGKGWKKC